ncbi:MAG: EamA family transporter RarD [Rhodocyclaceae bacterium]|nr:EamA family transporter RarD [Rhodocyclaceae bacterium]
MSLAETRRAAAAMIAAFAIWGLSPLYFKAVGALPALDIVAHRVLWSVLLLAAGLMAAGRVGSLARSLRAHPALGRTLVFTGLLNTANWLVFVWAINAGRVLEASLGYFINPLVSVLLGALVLDEQLRPGQRLAVAVAACGVCLRIWQLGALPWVALFLASSFACYGLLRKRAPVDPVGGLLVETVITLPLALAWFGWQAAHQRLDWALLGELGPLLPAAGLVTAVPLMLFAYGARRLTLSTVGFTQYLAPSLSFALAVWVFGEPIDATRLFAFVLIWCALAIYSADLWHASRRGPAASAKLRG